MDDFSHQTPIHELIRGSFYKGTVTDNVKNMQASSAWAFNVAASGKTGLIYGYY